MARTSDRRRPAQGARLVELRNAAGLSQRDLADILGVTQQAVAFWEYWNKPPRSDVLAKLAKVLGVSIETILGSEPIRRPGPTGKVQQLFEEVSKLPRNQREKVVEFVSAFVESHRNGHGNGRQRKTA